MSSPLPKNASATARVLLLAALAFCAATSGAVLSAKEFNVGDFGAIADGKTDAGPAFRKAIAAAQAAGTGSVVTVGAGVWRLLPAPGENACLPIANARGLTVRGEPGSAQLISGAARCSVFSLHACEETTIRGFAIDYDPLPFTQGRIVAVDTNAATFDLMIDPGYASLGEPMFAQTTAKYERWGMVMDARTRWLKPGAPNFILMGRFTPLADGVWRLQLSPGEESKLPHLTPGDLFVQLARGSGAAFRTLNSRACAIEDNLVFSSPTASVIAVANDGLTVRALHVRYKPGTDRLISTDADGVHCAQNIRGPRIEGCSFEGMADDAINLYSPATIVRERLSPTELIVSGAVIESGDRLQIIDPQSGRVRGETVAARIEPLAGKQKLALAAPVNGIVAGADYQSADTIYNLTRCGAGYVIRGNQFNRFRGRGILLRAGDGIIEGNSFTDPSSNDIVLANEPDWPEGPIPWNIMIRGNTFRGGGDDALIRIMAFRLRHQLAQGRSLRGITIESNRFTNPPGMVIYVGAASGVAIRNNQITLEPGVKPRRSDSAVGLFNCEGVTIENLTVTDPGQGYQTVVRIDSTVEKGAAGVRINNLKAGLDGRPAVRDGRTADAY
jgi:hypothetical protein